MNKIMPQIEDLIDGNCYRSESVPAYHDSDEHNMLVNYDGDVEFNIKGNLKFNVGEHIILQSGKGQSKHDESVLNSIWLNPSLDENGNPMVSESKGNCTHKPNLSKLSRRLKRLKR